MTCLFIEDNPLDQMLARRMCILNSVELTIYSDARSGIDAALELKPDFIVTDMMVPGLSCVEIIETIKSYPELAAIPLYVLTAGTCDDTLDMAKQKGADECILKPLTPVKLRSLIDKCA